MTYASGTSESSLQTRSYGVTTQIAQGGQILGAQNQIVLGLEYRNDQVDSPSNFTSAFGPWPTKKAVAKNILGVFLQNNLSVNKTIALSLGARYDKEDIDLVDNLNSTQNKTRRVSNLSPNIGVVVSPYESLEIFTNLSQSFKAPEANAMLYETPGLFSPNPDIEPTVANQFEAGLKFTEAENNSAKLSVFNINANREILYNSASFKNENYDTLRRGIELMLKRPLVQSVTVSLGYTYNQALFLGGQFSGNRIPLTPENKYSVQIDYQIQDNLNLNLDWLTVSGQYTLNDFNNLYPVERYNVLNGKFSFSIQNADTYIAVRNLLNEKYSAYVTSNAAGEIRYNPLPERSIFVGTKISL
jgi:outer membrane receptor protein involved in Fe transport